ncbi:unnamed protein product, partial [Medioppia subpectinata]
FLGIPYAEPPVGDLRFKKPMPVREAWPKPVGATKWPKACIHAKLHNYYLNADMSEDCLYLNVWSPALPESNTTLKPVMFWIHGGGVLFGSAVEKWYSGHVLSAMGDVVVVTFNYRLNTFGLLYTGAAHADGAPGNMALWDQSLALEWVVDNIAYFGGDPKRITLFGQGAGAVAISLHIVSPITRHLFQRAIMMSGATTNTMCTAATSEEVWRKRAVAIGCGDKADTTGKTFTPPMIECLKKLSAEDLLKLPALASSACEMELMIDGQFVPQNPIEMLKSGDYKKDMDVMIGTVDNEGSLFLPSIFDNGVFDQFYPNPITYSDAIIHVLAIIRSYKTQLGDLDANSQHVINTYFNGMSNVTHYELLLRTVGRVLGDYRVTCPTKLFARYIHSGHPKSRVYEYYYNAKSTAGHQLFCSDWMGVCHFDDIYPVFGLPFQEYDRYDRRERQTSAQMMDVFTEFARNGQPSKQSGADWRPYYTVNDNTVIAPRSSSVVLMAPSLIPSMTAIMNIIVHTGVIMVVASCMFGLNITDKYTIIAAGGNNVKTLIKCGINGAITDTIDDCHHEYYCSHGSDHGGGQLYVWAQYYGQIYHYSCWRLILRALGI